MLRSAASKLKRNNSRLLRRPRNARKKKRLRLCVNNARRNAPKPWSVQGFKRNAKKRPKHGERKLAKPHRGVGQTLRLRVVLGGVVVQLLLQRRCAKQRHLPGPQHPHKHQNLVEVGTCRLPPGATRHQAGDGGLVSLRKQMERVLQRLSEFLHPLPKRPLPLRRRNNRLLVMMDSRRFHALFGAREGVVGLNLVYYILCRITTIALLLYYKHMSPYGIMQYCPHKSVSVSGESSVSKNKLFGSGSCGSLLVLSCFRKYF